MSTIVCGSVCNIYREHMLPLFFIESPPENGMLFRKYLYLWVVSKDLKCHFIDDDCQILGGHCLPFYKSVQVLKCESAIRCLL